MKSILVLNADYLPLNVTSFKKGYKLAYKGKAEVLKIDEANPIFATAEFPRPSVIRLLKYVSYPYKRITLTRHNVFKRDGHACVYCSSKKELTLDHVLPKSRGGRDSWENLVTCCSKCNIKKADRTPEEAKMHFNGTPTAPNHFYMLTKNNNINEDWKQYIFM